MKKTAPPKAPAKIPPVKSAPTPKAPPKKGFANVKKKGK